MSVLPGSHEVTRFRALIADLLGLHFDESKLGNLAKVLHNRVALSGGECAQYLDLLSVAQRPFEELYSVARELTVTETYFLRNADQFNAYADIALPERLAASGGAHKVRILSAGCASGEEPYSLAMATAEHHPQAAHRVSITALDVNPAMLEKAARGRYSNWSLREFPANLKTRWFRPEGDGFMLDEAIRGAVKFEQRNLAQDAPDFWQPDWFDIVFCRNVLMYFTPEKAQAAVERIARALAPGGYLFLGHAETLRGLSNDFHLCHTHDTFYYQRKEGASAPQLAPHGTARWQPTVQLGDASWVEAIQRASDRIEVLAAPSGAAAVEAPADAMRAAPDLDRALEHLHGERFDQTLLQLGSLPAAYARDPDVLLLKAVSLTHSGALAAAEAVCRDLLECDELHAGAHYVLALCREGVGDTLAALEHDQAAVYLDPDFAMPRLHLGLLARRQGERAGARRDLAHALLLLQKEDASRLLLFGGGFKREALLALCRAELAALGEAG